MHHSYNEKKKTKTHLLLMYKIFNICICLHKIRAMLSRDNLFKRVLYRRTIVSSCPFFLFLGSNLHMHIFYYYYFFIFAKRFSPTTTFRTRMWCGYVITCVRLVLTNNNYTSKVSRNLDTRHRHVEYNKYTRVCFGSMIHAHAQFVW